MNVLAERTVLIQISHPPVAAGLPDFSHKLFPSDPISAADLLRWNCRTGLRTKHGGLNRALIADTTRAAEQLDQPVLHWKTRLHGTSRSSSGLKIAGDIHSIRNLNLT
jgi:hypothetical protein